MSVSCAVRLERACRWDSEKELHEPVLLHFGTTSNNNTDKKKKKTKNLRQTPDQMGRRSSRSSLEAGTNGLRTFQRCGFRPRRDLTGLPVKRGSPVNWDFSASIWSAVPDGSSAQGSPDGCDSLSVPRLTRRGRCSLFVE